MKGDGVEIAVKLTPRSSRNRLELQPDGQLRVWVRSAPTDNQANDSLCRFLAEQLHIGKSNVAIISGHTSRQKRLYISGLDKDTLAKLLSQ